MKVQGLNGREYVWKLTKHYNKKRDNASKLHTKARELLKDMLPVRTILEEVTLPGSSQKRDLSADFIILDLKLIVEVHGEQHYKFNNFYYANVREFVRAKARDRNKIEWAELNNFTLIVLPFNKIEEWEGLINGRYDT